MILVVGATGLLGSKITHRLLAAGQDVRILVRPQSSFQPLVDAGATPALGDLKDPLSLAAACEGIEYVISTANAAGRGGDDTIQSVDTEGNRALIDAAREAAVRQFIFVSSLGVSVDSPVPFMKAKANTEIYLQRSRMSHTILAPWVFLDVWVPSIIGAAVQQARPVTLIGEGRRRHSFIAVDDVAAFAVAAVGHAAAINQYLPMGGPEAVSWRDLIGYAERELGRAIPVQTIPVGESLPGAPELVTGLMTYMATESGIVDMSDRARTFGVRQTSASQWMHRFFAGQRER